MRNPGTYCWRRRIGAVTLALIGNAGWLVPVHAGDAAYAAEIAVFASETPRVQAMLEQGFAAEIGHGQLRSPLRAAMTYCDAVREGSAEANYRLGRLYLTGSGVEKNLRVAATLFGIAAQAGHRRANDMLGLTGVRAEALPDCVTNPDTAWNAYSEPDPLDIERYAEELPQERLSIVALIRRLAPGFGIDPRLALSIAAVESNFNAQARSPKNAIGVMQLIPDTAARFGVKNSLNAEQNIRGGLAYLQWLMAFFGNDLTLVIAAYNAGEGAVMRYRGVPPYAETQAYVRRVLQYLPPPVPREERRRPMRGGLPY